MLTIFIIGIVWRNTCNTKCEKPGFAGRSAKEPIRAEDSAELA